MYSTKLDGETLEFGTSGFLYRSNKLMYDRGTQSLWHQFRGEPVVGPLADSGIKLEILPVVLTTWEEWRATHPGTTVLDINTGVYPAESYPSEPNPDSVYYNYRQDPGTMFTVWQRSDLLPTKAEVLGVMVIGQAKAYPLDLLRQRAVINDSLGGKALVVVTEAKAGAARVYERATHLFSLAPASGTEGGAITLADQQGRRWQVEEDALVQVENPDQRLQRLPSHVAYWFGWYAFYPFTAVYAEGDR